MSPGRERAPSTRAVSEALGTAVLVGMTILIVAALGAGVMVLNEEEAEQTAEFDYTLLGDQLVIEYQDERERRAGTLYIEGPENNVSWAEVDENRGPDDVVREGTFVQVGPGTAYGATVGEQDTFRMIYFTEDGDRLVLDTWNEGTEGAGDSPLDPDEPGGPDGPEPPRMSENGDR